MILFQDTPDHLQTITAEQRRLLLEAAERSLPTDSQPIPREIQQALRRIYTPRQLVLLTVKSLEIKCLGFGKLTITFAKHHPKWIEKNESEELPE